MNAMLVGADTLGNIPNVLNEFGISIHRHVSGRNSAHQRKSNTLPADTDLLILFTDFLGHNVMKHFRSLAASRDVRFVACRRSTCALKQALSAVGLQTCSGCDTPCGSVRPLKRV
ncbi:MULTISPECIES: DUF2325 domain-containing protein [Microvirgula]|uniref:DUF2325 domain-containing protein n=1 Tax=Microvirgula aerodenitrificans TaxID=57480 RepID=A0A2S0PB68_9NEIS|nr:MULTISPECIES: DUF2325 domain-containing protein [Microvirgula]AVY94630.1 DUF2325 domain-containing protein [Microvirgula aerodenitrificans]RAS18882.1 hypothetical protein DFO50_10235 [Microvirgula sp. AG722]